MDDQKAASARLETTTSPSGSKDQSDQSDSDHAKSPDRSRSTEEGNSHGEQLSKRQLKRRRKREYWETVRREKRKEERKRRQKRRADALANGESICPNRKRLKPNNSEDINCKITVAIDMSFDEHMSERDTKKALTQIQYCYSVNRRSQQPINLYVTSFCGKSRDLFDRTRGCDNWDEKRIQLKREDYATVFQGKEDLVYLSSESQNVLETLDEDKVYVIGGLVDHNAHKGLCHRIAQDKGLKHARLPIDEYVLMKTRKVLTINHVFEIMLKYKEIGDWEKAFFQVLPKRKDIKKKDESKEGSPQPEKNEPASDTLDSNGQVQV